MPRMARAVIEDWENEPASPEDDGMLEMIRSRTYSGFPCGDEAFAARLKKVPSPFPRYDTQIT